MPTITLTRIEQRFSANQSIEMTVGGKEITLENGGSDRIKLPRGEHQVNVTTRRNGKINGTVILPEHKEIEVGFTVSDKKLIRRLILALLLVGMSIWSYYYFDFKWAFLGILAGTIPGIITNRHTLYVDVIGEPIVTAPQEEAEQTADTPDA